MGIVFIAPIPPGTTPTEARLSLLVAIFLVTACWVKDRYFN